MRCMEAYPRAAMERASHSDVKTTLQLYAHKCERGSSGGTGASARSDFAVQNDRGELN